MPISSGQISVTSTATALTGASDDDERADFSVVATNRGTLSVFLGNSTVTTATGLELAVGATVNIELRPGDRLYAIAVSGTQRVDVLKAGVV